MNKGAFKQLKIKIMFIFPLTFLVLAAMLFLPAGSLEYWQGWIFLIIILFSAFFVVFYFLKKSPEFLERRIMFKEKEEKQREIIKIANVFFFSGFLFAGFDFRFGWSHVPWWLVIAADITILLSYFLVFLAFKENVFAGRTVETFKGQKVIDTGPYAIVRHPMYAGLIPMFLFIPLALGSFWALVFFVPTCMIIIVRALDEEKVLKRDLPGYNKYCRKVHYHLVPFIW